MFRFSRFSLFVVALLVAISAFGGVAYASHAWGSYHWARIANPFTLQIGDNVGGAWDASLALASADWSLSSVLDTVVVFGKSNPKNCRAVLGRVEVCNNKYGANGWLGLASIWVNSDHIVQGTVKLNDTYFNTTRYNKPEWRNFVTCQEVGHTFGLNHQDEIFDNPNLGTCMDYTSDPTTNQHPNQHDYDQLEATYAHVDSITTVLARIFAGKGSTPEIDHDNKQEWGKEVRKSGDGHGALYERDFGKGSKVYTFVVWADEKVLSGEEN